MSNEKPCCCAGESVTPYTETEAKPQINQDAVRLMNKIHGIDMEKT